MNIFKSTERTFDIFCLSEDMAYFLNLQGTVKLPTLMWFDQFENWNTLITLGP